MTADEVAALAHVLDVTPTDLLASPVRSAAVHRTIVVADVANPPDTAVHLAEVHDGLHDVLKSAFSEADTDTAVPSVSEALRLGEPYRRWLLIFDNAGSPDAVQKFLPANGPGEVLITSRNPDWSGIARPLGVPVFNRSESVELMRRRGLDIEDEAEYERLAERLGDLPLAVEQAAAMQVMTGMPVGDYLRLFDEKVAEVLDVSAPAGHGISVSAVWDTAFGELTARNPGAYQLLQICAFFAAAPISRNMLTEVPGVSVSRSWTRCSGIRASSLGRFGTSTRTGSRRSTTVTARFSYIS